MQPSGVARTPSLHSMKGLIRQGFKELAKREEGQRHRMAKGGESRRRDHRGKPAGERQIRQGAGILGDLSVGTSEPDQNGKI